MLCGYGSFGLCLALFLPHGAMVWACIGQLMLGITYSGNMVLLKSIVGDTAEAAKDDLGADCTGRLFAIYMRSEERRVGKECVSTCRSRWSPDTYKHQ